jgi:uncharacterized protein (TIGR02466 family)
MLSGMIGTPLHQHLVLTFATPVVVYPWPDSEVLNLALTDVVLQAERTSRGLQRSNVGGWHSGLDFLDAPVGPIAELRQRIVDMIMAVSATFVRPGAGDHAFNYSFEGWANVIRNGQYASVHNHPKCQWSGVYYVSSGQPQPAEAPNGRLELIDPRAGANLMLAGSKLEERPLIEPTPGVMVLFPSWLQHLVHPFFGKGERISIAFNVMTAETGIASL